MRSVFFYLVLASVIFLSASAIAQWSNNPNINTAIVTVAFDQGEPAMVSDGMGGAIITWQDFRYGTDYQIFAQRIDANGYVLWGVNGVEVSEPMQNQFSPSIVSDGFGGAIITWADLRVGDYDIYAQKIDANGVKQWMPDGMPICIAPGNQLNPEIISDGSGGAIITWIDRRSGGFLADIYAQRVASNGNVQWTFDGVAVTTTSTVESPPKITSDGAGGAVIVWTDNSDYEVYAQIIYANGALSQTGNILVSIGGNYAMNPVLTNDGQGGVIIAWEERFSLASLGIIYAQRIDLLSELVLWMPNGVLITSASSEHASIEKVGSVVIICWTDHRDVRDIYAQAIDINGVVQWMADGVAVSSAPGVQRFPKIIDDGDSGAIITWEDSRNQDFLDIYAQRINELGVIQWAINGVPVSTKLSIDKLLPEIVSDGAEGAIIVWTEFLSNGFENDIYAQKVNNLGTLGNPPDGNLLLFAQDSHLREANTSYTDTLRLTYENETGLNSLSFKLRSNPPGSDNILSLTGVEKGDDISSADWNLDYEYKTHQDGDYLIVFLYGQDSTTLSSGVYNDFIRFSYEVSGISGSDTLRSHFRLEEIHSSFINGYSAGVSGDDDQIIDAYRSKFYGDINMDNSVDIQDLMMLRDYILERLEFNVEEWERANLAPWEPGSPVPSPDTYVNVQDFSLLQNIILTGHYPDVSDIPETLENFQFTGNGSISDNNVTFDIKQSGISITTNSVEKITGIQVEMTYAGTVPSGTTIVTSLGNGYIYTENGLLRVLCYDNTGNTVLEPGENIILNIPLSIANPDNVEITGVLLINHNLEKITGVTVEVKREGGIVIPSEYMLFQNYPNPFNPGTTISWQSPVGSRQTLKVYDLLGREVAVLVDEFKEAGIHSILFDASGLSTGIYLYKLTAGEFTLTKKLILIK